ncbi:hypothetical protein U1Q18_000730 [Sarracenia purpurea var. burkii]
MGCTQSKIETEESVSRCKERRKLIKDVVSAQNAFAAAHSTYAFSLKNTSVALNDYAHSEVQHPPIAGAGAVALPTNVSRPSLAIVDESRIVREDMKRRMEAIDGGERRSMKVEAAEVVEKAVEMVV